MYKSIWYKWSNFFTRFYVTGGRVRSEIVSDQTCRRFPLCVYQIHYLGILCLQQISSEKGWVSLSVPLCFWLSVHSHMYLLPVLLITILHCTTRLKWQQIVPSQSHNKPRRVNICQTYWLQQLCLCVLPDSRVSLLGFGSRAFRSQFC